MLARAQLLLLQDAARREAFDRFGEDRVPGAGTRAALQDLAQSLARQTDAAAARAKPAEGKGGHVLALGILVVVAVAVLMICLCYQQILAHRQALGRPGSGPAIGTRLGDLYRRVEAWRIAILMSVMHAAVTVQQLRSRVREYRSDPRFECRAYAEALLYYCTSLVQRADHVARHGGLTPAWWAETERDLLHLWRLLDALIRCVDGAGATDAWNRLVGPSGVVRLLVQDIRRLRTHIRATPRVPRP
jgi:hypothetical protein